MCQHLVYTGGLRWPLCAKHRPFTVHTECLSNTPSWTEQMSPIFFVNIWPITRYPHTKHFQTYLHSSPKQLLEIDTKLSSFRRCIVKVFGVWYQMQCYELIMFQEAICIMGLHRKLVSISFSWVIEAFLAPQVPGHSLLSCSLSGFPPPPPAPSFSFSSSRQKAPISWGCEFQGYRWIIQSTLYTNVI